ncbi:unnamed protein product [Triticum turgidum subsp. durum]|uniref:Uncharacterized protein n=1 Tax=Triticum turgidum subsp. durum TaxID=4567 RepID=A0A9R0ZMX9_TRITD|nr:unnamed protein product [Triticum turgidum subsp. durum]
MEGGQSSGKRASAEEVKSEPEEGEVLMMMQDGGEGGGASVAAESMAPAQIDVRMDLTLLHCQGCLLPLKPPVFKAAPQFWCKLSVERLGGDNRDRLVLMASAVSSSALSTGAPAPGQGMFLAVPQELLSGDTLTLTVRIDMIRPAAGAAAAPKSTTPQPRTARRMQ